jgi:hypothetical protein
MRLLLGVIVLAWTRLIGAAIEDQLAGTGRERTELQSSRSTENERVVLNDLDRAVVGQRHRPA